MAESDISAEQRLIQEMGCEIAAWNGGEMVIRYREGGQRGQLISALQSLGWTHPVDDPGDADAMLLDIRRAPTQPYPPSLVMQSGWAGQVIVGIFAAFIVVMTVYDVQQDIARNYIARAIIAGLTYTLIIAIILYLGLPYVTLKVMLTPQEIILVNVFKKLTLKISAIQSLAIEAFTSFGLPFCNFEFTMKNGVVHRLPASYKEFYKIADEIRKRYAFNVSP